MFLLKWKNHSAIIVSISVNLINRINGRYANKQRTLTTQQCAVNVLIKISTVGRATNSTEYECLFSLTVSNC